MHIRASWLGKAWKVSSPFLVRLYTIYRTALSPSPSRCSLSRRYKPASVSTSIWSIAVKLARLPLSWRFTSFTSGEPSVGLSPALRVSTVS